MLRPPAARPQGLDKDEFEQFSGAIVTRSVAERPGGNYRPPL
jgi:hypothetical protein